MKPIEHMPTMAALDFPPRLSNGDMALPLLLQTIALFFQEDISQYRQRPEAHNCRATRQRHLALYHVSSKTWVTVPATGSKVRMTASISSILLWKDMPSISQTACCRYSCGARGQRRPNTTYRLWTRLWPRTRLSWV